MEDTNENTFNLLLNGECQSVLFAKRALNSQQFTENNADAKNLTEKDNNQTTDISMKYFPIPSNPAQPTLLVTLRDGSGFEILHQNTVQQLQEVMNEKSHPQVNFLKHLKLLCVTVVCTSCLSQSVMTNH